MIALASLAIPLAASAGGGLVLHPSGFGQHSYSSWKAHEGLPDSKGNDSQALYFQKMTTTATVAAGVAVIKGLEGVPADQLNGLGWDHRVDGHCGAGAPRWNVNLRDALGNNYTVFLGCFAAAHSPTAAAPTAWCRDTYSASDIDAQILAQTGQAPASLQLRNLAIVFDEGTDNPIPQPPGCPPGASTPGFVFLDNITVDVNGQVHIWTGASDNGNGQTIMQSSEPLESLLEASLDSLFSN